MKTNIMILISALCACATLSIAAEQNYVNHGAKRSINMPAQINPLIEGPGKDITSQLCNICHSLDYITTQQKFTKARWQAEVTKMVKTYGAPVSDENAKTIVDYISTYYGTGG